MMTRTKFFACGILLASLSACSRNEIGQDIELTVVSETEVRDPFDGTLTLEQSPAADAMVYLVPYGQGGTSAAYRSAGTDIDGKVRFAEVEGRYRAWVDAGSDGTIDATSSPIRSGQRAIVVVGQQATGAESTIKLAIERETYYPGDTVNVKVWGSFSAPHTVAVEVWNDATDRTRKHVVTLGEFSGDFSTATVFTVKSDWPLTPNSRLADYLVVPRVGEEFYDGARFSVRRPVQSYAIDGISLELNDGDPVTSLRNVTASLAGNNVSTVALAEDPADFAAGLPVRLAFAPEVGFQLSAGDGLKTVWAMFYDIDGGYAGPISDTIYLDSQPVVPITGMGITINYGAATTNSRNVELALAATAATYMAFSENQAAFPYGVARQPFASTAAFQLSAGDGLKTVWVQYYDEFGRFYGPVSDSITVDTSIPIAPVTNATITINAGAFATNDRNVALTLGASNATAMAFAEDPGLFPNGVFRYSFATDFGYRLSAGDGTKTVWAMYFDAGGNYYAPVSASINLVTQPTTPIVNMSLLINGGATGTNNPNLTLSITADNAFMMAITEVSGTLPYQVVRYPFSNSIGYTIRGGEGITTIWAMFYDIWGNYAGPVSATIAYDQNLPALPDSGLMFVTYNPPGMHDFLSGLPGAVQADSLVKVYRDPFLTQLLTQGYAGADGSFTLFDIGDGSAGNVFKPQDWVFVTATNSYGNASTAAIVENDSTPPEFQFDDLMALMDVAGSWVVDSLGAGVGNVGDKFEAIYTIPSGFAPATDVTGGQFDLSNLGGPAVIDFTMTSPGNFAAEYVVPPELILDTKEQSFRARIVDEAFNYSAWESTQPLHAVDTVPPDPVFITTVLGGNKQLDAQWTDPNLDTASYALTLTAHTGTTQNLSVMSSEYCSGSANFTRACAYELSGIDIGSPGTYTGNYQIHGLNNCHYWNLAIEAIDDGGNRSTYSNSVSDYVTLGWPYYQTWSGIAKGTAMIAFGVANAFNATGYEVDFSTATGAPYEYDAGLYSSPFTISTFDPNGFVARFPGLPTNTVFYTAMRSVDDSGPFRCYSEYSPEVTARTEVYVAAVTDGVERTTVGGALAAVRDLDGDSFTDILAGAPYPQNVTLVSGNTGVGIESFGIYHAPDSYDIPGTPLAAGDIDGPLDSAHEFIVGSPLEAASGKLLAGRVRVYDDDRTTVLATFDGSAAGQQFGYSVTTVQITPGGYSNFAVGGFGCAHKDCGYTPLGAPATEGPGRVVLYGGQSLTPLATFDGGELGDYFGVALAGGKDITGDGIADLVIGSPGSGYVLPPTQVHIVDGETLDLVNSLTFDSSGAAGIMRPGAALAMLDDVTGDGIADLAVGVPMANGEPGMVLLVAGGTFVVRWMQFGGVANAGPNFGAVLAAGGDVNGDGVPDLVVGAPLGQQNFFYGAGSAYVLDGASGTILYEFEGWGENLGRDGSVGYSVLLPGNIRGGPRAEWVVGAPGSAYGGYQSGRIYILSTDW